MSLPVIPKKSLGQNFLNSDWAIARVRDAADPTPGDIILEIGPGLGALTEMLLKFAGKIVAVEKDHTLYEMLSDRFAPEIGKNRLDLIEGDILKFDPGMLKFYKDFTYKLVANIPYNLTGQIFRKFLTAKYQPETMVVLIQKEVAARILARDGKESLLSLSIKAYGTPSLVTHVSRGNFTPAPRVDSSIIVIDNISRNHFSNTEVEKLFFKMIHAGFAHKRKMLVKNMLDAKLGSKDFWEEVLQKRSLSAGIRAEDLSLGDWLFIAELMYNHG